MISLDQIFTTSDSEIIHTEETMVPDIILDYKNDIPYVGIENIFTDITSGEEKIQYFLRENMIQTNHIELYGQDAVSFDTTVNSIKHNNQLMTELLKEIYEDRIFKD